MRTPYGPAMTKADLIVKLAPDGKSFTLHILKRADDGAIIGARVKEFQGELRARDLTRHTRDWFDWRQATAEELETVRRIVAKKWQAL